MREQQRHSRAPATQIADAPMPEVSRGVVCRGRAMRASPSRSMAPPDRRAAAHVPGGGSEDRSAPSHGTRRRCRMGGRHRSVGRHRRRCRGRKLRGRPCASRSPCHSHARCHARRRAARGRGPALLQPRCRLHAPARKTPWSQPRRPGKAPRSWRSRERRSAQEASRYFAPSHDVKVKGADKLTLLMTQLRAGNDRMPSAWMMACAISSTGTRLLMACSRMTR